MLCPMVFAVQMRSRQQQRKVYCTSLWSQQTTDMQADMLVHHAAGITQTCAVSLWVEFDHFAYVCSQGEVSR